MRAPVRAALAGCIGLAPLIAHAAGGCAGFSDVDSAASYCAAVEYIKNTGITSGCGNGGTYCPNDYVTRAQMALFMARLARGGASNTITDWTASIGGGYQNSATAVGATIAGGSGNLAQASGATVGGGYNNTAGFASSVVAGGVFNTALADNATVGGGTGNSASGYASTVPGGYANSALGNYSFVAGHNAHDAGFAGSFIWADGSVPVFQPSRNNFFGARATGGVGFVVAIDGSGAPTSYCNFLPEAPSWQCTSDRNAKENLVEADGRTVLDELSAMPVYTYSMKGSDASVRSMGPTAQDFRAAFGLGNDDRTIASINLEGVALAAIKELKSELDRAHAREAVLEQRLERLEARSH